MAPTHFIIHTIDLKPGTLDDPRSFFEEVVPKLAGSFDSWCGARRGSPLTAKRIRSSPSAPGPIAGRRKPSRSNPASARQWLASRSILPRRQRRRSPR